MIPIRRNRIKGIANIPQRRKVELKNEDPVFAKPEEITASCNSKGVESSSNAEVQGNNSNNEGKDESSSVEQAQLQSQPQLQPLAATNSQNELPRRRNTIKPIVNRKLFQRSKVKDDNVTNQSNKDDGLDSINAVPSVLELQPSDSSSSNNNNSNNTPSEVKHEQPLNTSSPRTDITKPESDEACPLSPTKLINRSRIKAVPKLSHRRTSVTIYGSASESEDDGKRNFKRIRTESTCSSISTSNEPSHPQSDLGSPQKNKEFSSIIQRKCKRTEQSRKMAEARRQFQHKFSNQVPDKQKLTMMDLIFYNPVSNPMSQKPKKQAVEELVEEAQAEEDNLSKNDDEDEQEALKESDEENNIPAPQIKIGPNGEIVIDEKSLIIENEETKRHREEIQKSKIVDGDFDTGYGIYKREKRSKDWSKEETLRFYKALNTIGTDFTLMLELFQGRNRRELKMKFKKEERVNQQLIDKALTQPVHFDITELRKETEDQMLIQQLKEKQKLEPKPKAREMVPYIGKFKDKAKIKKEKARLKPVKRKSRDVYTSLEKGLSSICKKESDKEESDAEGDEEAVVELNEDKEEDGDSETSENEEVTEPTIKPTRSGRVPKRRKPFAPGELTIAKKKTPKEECNNIGNLELDNNNLSSLNTLQPGSIMIVASQTPTGEPAFNVFMVTPTQNRVPITLTPDVLSNLTQNQEQSVDNSVNKILPDGSSEMAAIPEEIVNQEMCPYEQNNISIPQNQNIDLPEDKNITLCSDGKYNIDLAQESN